MDDARADDAREARLGDDGERLAPFLDRWLNDVARAKLRPATVASYASVIERHIVPAIGAKRLRDLQLALVQGFYALDSGARQGELWALEWQDVDLEAGVVRIRRTLKDGNDGIVVGPTKGKSERSITVSRSTITALRSLDRQRIPLS